MRQNAGGRCFGSDREYSQRGRTAQHDAIRYWRLPADCDPDSYDFSSDNAYETKLVALL